MLLEVEKAVDKLKNRKNPGVHGISTELIYAGKPALITEIHRL